MSTARLSRIGCLRGLRAFPVVSVFTGLGLLALVFPAVATYEEGEAAYAQRAYSKAEVYRFGRGVPKDEEQAMFWYRKAAAQGNPRALKEVE